MSSPRSSLPIRSIETASNYQSLLDESKVISEKVDALLDSESEKSSKNSSRSNSDSDITIPVNAEDLDLAEHKPEKPAWPFRKKLLAGSIMLLALAGGAIAAWRLSLQSSSTPPSAPDNQDPYAPLTSCPTYNISTFQNMIRSVTPIISAGYTLQSNCDGPYSPLEKKYLHAHYSLIKQPMGNITLAVLQPLGLTLQQIQARSYNFTLASDYNAQGNLKELQDDETICIYNNKFAFSESDPDFITSRCENIFIVACRTFEDSLCNSLETVYALNEKLASLAKNKKPTAYVTQQTAIEVVEEDNLEKTRQFRL